MLRCALFDRAIYDPAVLGGHGTSLRYVPTVCWQVLLFEVSSFLEHSTTRVRKGRF